MSRPRHILVLGATGYVGRRLAPRLLAAGHRVTCLVRDAGKLDGLAWTESADVVEGDLDSAEGLHRACAGADVVCHLVHSMGGGADFAAQDRRIAHNVARAAAAAGVGRIIYLGGLGAGTHDPRSSTHLRSRAEVAAVLMAGPVPVTVLRAAVIIGSGSASFEMLRHLVEVLPVMVTPRWVRSRVQPIAIGDVLRYLVGILDVDDAGNHVYDIAGPDVLTYEDMMRIYARVQHLPRRAIISLPLLTPKLSSYWVGLVTPVPTAIARPLVESLISDAVAGQGEDIAARLPGPCVPYRQALALALRRMRDPDRETSWRAPDLLDRAPAEPYPGDPPWSGGTRYEDVRTATCSAGVDELFRVVCGVGGDRGWPTHRWAWRMRGVLDRMVGGSGLRRGRRDPHDLRVGDALDFWRVEDVTPPAGDRAGHLRLRAEMRLPGNAWLEFRVAARGGGSVLRQRAVYAPRGLLGRLYWWALLPFHRMIFPAMAAAFARQAAQAASATNRSAPVRRAGGYQ